MMRRSRRRNKQRKIIIISICSILLIMTVGYAAMQTNLSISVKGNVVKNATAGSDLVEEVGTVTSGDGLYVDGYEENVYTYRGANPNNYVTFNNELWRIISINIEDNTIKIMRNNNLGMIAFDSAGLRDGSSNGAGGTYCANSSFGCNAWAISNNFDNGTYTGTVLKDAELNIYLNGEYLNGLLDSNKIVTHNYSVGAVTSGNSNLAEQITSENGTVWNGKVGMITSSEYIRANTNSVQCGTISLNNDNGLTCLTTNWMYSLVPSNGYLWTITPNTTNASLVLTVSKFWDSEGILGINHAYSTSGAERNAFSAYPVVTLSPEIQITDGIGSSSDPFQISL